MNIYMMKRIVNGDLLGPAFISRELAEESWRITCHKVPRMRKQYEVVEIPVLTCVEHL